MSQTDTKTCILDAAEKLFAEDGFHNTSLRGITSLATVNLAAVNYHFGCKDALLQAVIDRRLLPLNQLRRQKLQAALDRAEATGRRPEVRQLLCAFIEPTLEFRNSSPGAKDFIALIGRAMNEPDETIRNCFLRQVLPIFQLLFSGLQRALPDLSENILMARLQFTMGTMGHVMCISAQPALQIPGFPNPVADDKLAKELITFVCAGLEAPC